MKCNSVFCYARRDFHLRILDDLNTVIQECMERLTKEHPYAEIRQALAETYWDDGNRLKTVITIGFEEPDSTEGLPKVTKAFKAAFSAFAHRNRGTFSPSDKSDAYLNCIRQINEDGGSFIPGIPPLIEEINDSQIGLLGSVIVLYTVPI